MNGSDFGRALGSYFLLVIIVATIVGGVVGIGVYEGAKWCWHHVHVTVTTTAPP